MTTRVIVLNWNGQRWLERCVPALLQQRRAPTEIVVVDNASTDDSVAWLRRHHPSIRVLVLGENLGFAAGNNRGAADAATDALVFLNNDTEPDPDWLDRLVSAAIAERERAVVTSCVVYWDRPDRVDSAGDGYLRCGGGYKEHHGQPLATAPGARAVFGACGAAFLIRREWFERVGGFDETLFMVYEDVDLSYRVRLQGGQVWYAADARVRHGGSAAMGRVSALAVECGQRNLEWVWLVNTPAVLLWWSAPSHLLYNLFGALAYWRHGRGRAWWRGKWAAVRAVPRAWARRREVQATRTVPVVVLWRQMSAGWIGIKRREKQFDFSPGS